MKGFKKLALVAAIAAPLSSVHALEALDDSMLSDMTGQAGVTIDLETQVKIGQVAWTDTNEGAAGEVGGGSVLINDIFVGGWTGGGEVAGDRLDDIRLVIDSAASGDLEILVVTQSAFDAAGNPTGAPTPVDMGITVGSFALDGTAGTSTIASNINMNVLLAPQKFVVKNADYVAANGNLGKVGSGSISAQGFFQLHESSTMKLDVVGVDVTSLKVGNFLGDNATTGQAGANDFTGTDYTQAGFAYYNVDIYANAADQLGVEVNNFNVDVQLTANIGNASIGQISMTDFDVSGTSLRVYGH